jgi:hypothetical protein
MLVSKILILTRLEITSFRSKLVINHPFRAFIRVLRLFSGLQSQYTSVDLLALPLPLIVPIGAGNLPARSWMSNPRCARAR